MPDPTTLRLGLIQHACSDDARANVDKAVALIRDAAAQGATLIATQELFAGLYFPQEEDEAHFALAETIPGPTSARLCDLAKEVGVTLTASLFEKRAPGLFHNTSIMISPAGEIVDRYRKMHIPDDPCFFEKYYFAPGDLGWRTQRVEGVETGMLVCWDQWYPEAARLTALRGAQILFYPTAIAWMRSEPESVYAKQRDAWTTIQRSHAIANGVYVAAINRVGTEGELTFWGSSFIADPSGTIIAQADEASEQALVADIDLTMIEIWRKSWPFLRDRRIDAYGDIVRRYVD